MAGLCMTFLTFRFRDGWFVYDLLTFRFCDGWFVYDLFDFQVSRWLVCV